MKHYEIVFLVQPSQSDQVPSMIERYTGIVKNSGGNIHRVEDWGRRFLAYPIDKLVKAHYVMINIECGKEALEEITTLFKYNDSVIRHLVIRRNEAITEPSVLTKSDKDK